MVLTLENWSSWIFLKYGWTDLYLVVLEAHSTVGMLAVGSPDRWLQVRRFALLVRTAARPCVRSSAFPLVPMAFRPSVLLFLCSSVFPALRTTVLVFFGFPGLAYCRSLVLKFSGPCVLPFLSSSVRRYADPPELRYFGTQILRNSESPELKYFGTQMLRNSESPELRYFGSPLEYCYSDTLDRWFVDSCNHQSAQVHGPQSRSGDVFENSLNTEILPYRDTHSLALHWLNSFGVKCLKFTILQRKMLTHCLKHLLKRA